MLDASSPNLAVAQLFDELVELPRSERDRRLADQQLDPDTRIEIESLLAAHDDAGEFLSDGSGSGEARESFAAGTKLGRYELIEQIGEGGFAHVFRAAQSHPVRREVALKVIKIGMDTRALVARFEQERQALALMDHPNIAAVYDAGATESGAPFFVMELVRGRRIDRYCDDANLDARQRVALF